MKSIIFDYKFQKEEINERLNKRKSLFNFGLVKNIGEIFEDVIKNGDKAIFEATEKFDKVSMDSIKVSDSYIEQCISQMPDELKESSKKLLNNIIEVNTRLMPEKMWKCEIREGTIVGEITSPMESVGLWIPSRKGVLISSALMLIGAAKVAGVKNIIIGMPPKEDGLPDPLSTAAAKLAGADEIVIGNGVAIIAGWSVGTENVKKVDGIFGPGPAGISAAMTMANFYGVTSAAGIGPSDSVIIADGWKDPKILAYDLLNEAEHGADSTSILVTTSRENAIAVYEEIENILNSKNDIREEILKSIFGSDGTGSIIVVDSIDEAIEIANDFAPEHMMIKVSQKNEEIILKNINNCGEVVIGDYTPFSAANYAIGITHILPTNGYAKSYSGVTCKNMLKTTTIGKLNEEALLKVSEVISDFGKYEGLPYHAQASKVRFE